MLLDTNTGSLYAPHEHVFATGGGTVEGLTPRQEQVLEFIRASVRADGYPPTVREICAALDLSSPSTVHAHLANLERLGLIKRDPSKPRALDVVGDLRPPRPLPLVGSVAAGAPITAVDNVEDLVDVPGFLRRDDDDFVLRVRGDSMTGAGIFDADLIVVHPQPDARNGEIVVARVDGIADAEATAKRFFREGATVRLVAENENYEPIVVNADQVELVGRVVGVLRQL
jgi:repressor LexA